MSIHIKVVISHHISLKHNNLSSFSHILFFRSFRGGGQYFVLDSWYHFLGEGTGHVERGWVSHFFAMQLRDPPCGGLKQLP